MKIKLGFEDTYPTACCGPSDKDEKEKPRIVFPSFTVRGEAAKKLYKRLEAGQDISASCKLHVCSASKTDSDGERQWPEDGCSVELEVLDIEVEGEETAEKETSAEEAIDEYRSSKSK